MSAQAIYGAPPPGVPDDNTVMSQDMSQVGEMSVVSNTGNTSTVLDPKRNPRFSWTPSYEETFFASLCESVNLGLRENHSFKPAAWDRAASALREKHGAYPIKAHLVNKSDNARKKFRLWRGLREHPEFFYNPVTRTVTGSDEAWRIHTEKEPLSRSLRGRPFDHEHFMEILYPDVIGSGGAPKRIMKPRRKGPDAIPGNEDLDTTPGTSIMDLAQQGSPAVPAATPQRPPPQPTRTLHSNNNTARPPATVTNSSSVPTTNTGVGNAGHSGLNTSTALTPPDDAGASSTLAHTRKRFASSTATYQNQTTDKRRRTAYTSSANHNTGAAATSSTTTSAHDVQSVVDESLGTVAEALRQIRANANPRWTEQALDIFFREFSTEDMDLQIKIAEKVLLNENKAMVFVKMPPILRQHWVSRLREIHNRGGDGVGVGGNVMA